MILDLTLPCDYAALCEGVRAVCEAYDFASYFSVGQSLLGREIPCLRIGEGKKSIIYVGTTHACEHITASLLLRFAADLCECSRSGGKVYGLSIPYVLSARSVYILPMLNVDGVELCLHGTDSAGPLAERILKMNGHGDFSAWKANARGVDLNHNFSAGFAEYKQYERQADICAGSGFYSGESPESEPESGALCSLIRSGDFRMLLSFHTQGEQVFYDFDGYTPPMGRAVGQALCRMCGYSLCTPEGGAVYGGLKDWFITEFGRPGYTFECGRGQNPLPHTSLPGIYADLRRALFHAPVMI